MSGIRVTYSGLISLVTAIASLFLGMIFTLIVTRTLASEEFGTWSLINSLIFYVVAIEPVISYWATREVARGVESGKTAVLSSGVFSIGGIFGYIVISYFVGHQTNVNQSTFFFATILVPIMFLNGTLYGINLGSKPHAVTYGMLSFGMAEIPMALIFVYFLHMGVTGVILTVLVAYLTSLIILVFYAREKIKSKIKKVFLKKWLKLSWLPLYPIIGNLVFGLDFVIFSVITGSVIGFAFWSAAMILPKLITTSSFISKAVYPKLLQAENREYVKENLTQLFYFAIPFTAVVVTFVKPSLFIINPHYMTVVPVVIILAIHYFFYNLSTVLQSFLTGIERVDVNEKSTFKDYIRSKLFFVPTLVLIQYSVYLISLAIGLFLLLSTSSQIDLLIYWSIILLVTQLPFTIYFYVLVKRNFALKLELGIVLRYLMVAVGVFGITYAIMEHFLDYKNNIFEFLPNLLLFMGLAIGSYLVFTYFIDIKTRELFKAIIQEVRKTL